MTTESKDEIETLGTMEDACRCPLKYKSDCIMAIGFGQCSDANRLIKREPILNVHNICKLCEVPFGSEECESDPRKCVDTVTDFVFNIRKEERERVLKIAIGLIKHEGFLDIGYDEPIVLISDIERCFDAIRKVDDAKDGLL